MNLELEKKKLDLKKIEIGKLELEYKILERLADIDRIKQNIVKQDEAITRLIEEIKHMESDDV